MESDAFLPAGRDLTTGDTLGRLRAMNAYAVRFFFARPDDSLRLTAARINALNASREVELQSSVIGLRSEDCRHNPRVIVLVH